MTRQLLEDIRASLLREAAKVTLSDDEMEEVAKVVSKAIGKKAGYMMSDTYYHTGAIDFGGHGALDIFVGSKQEGSGKLPYSITVEDVEGEGPADKEFIANDYKSMLKIVQKLAKKHKKGLTSQ
jgi:hypothetical protein